MSAFEALWIEKTDNGFTRNIITRNTSDLPSGDLLIEVAYSSLNYKDAMSATGAPGVTRNYPHTPGIDAAGTVLETTSSDFAVGDEVIVPNFTFAASINSIIHSGAKPVLVDVNRDTWT